MIRTVGLAAFETKQKVLAVADLHLGLVDEYRERGIVLPQDQLKSTLNMLSEILRSVSCKTIVLLGDILHSFGAPGKKTLRDLRELAFFLGQHARVVFVRGNHDRMHMVMEKTLGIRTTPAYYAADVCYCHGDSVPRTKRYRESRAVIIGHVHPAVALRAGGRSETYKCFLFGKHGKRKIVVLPSFTDVHQGTDILEGTLSSPFLSDIGTFRVAVPGDRSYGLGTVAQLRTLFKSL